MNLSEIVAEGDRSHCVRNCSAVVRLSGDQIVESRAEQLSKAPRKRAMALRLARRMVLAPSTSSAGQAAFSNAKTASEFIATNFPPAAYSTPNRFLNLNLSEAVEVGKVLEQRHRHSFDPLARIEHNGVGDTVPAVARRHVVDAGDGSQLHH